ncbi:hypothetical protein JCM21900_002458 [Sporobolomyces salmonicolor]
MVRTVFPRHAFAPWSNSRRPDAVRSPSSPPDLGFSTSRQPSPFNCFSHTGHVETLPRHYTSSALPPLQASARSSSASRSPARKPSGRGRRSTDAGDRKGGFNKALIGRPTGFQHVGGAGIACAGGLMGQDLDQQLAADAPSASIPSTPPPSSPARPSVLDRHRSLPVPAPFQPFGDASNRPPPSPASPTSAVGAGAKPRARPASTQAPVTRKPPPPVTASVIRQAGGADAVAKTGAVPTLARIRAMSSPGPGLGFEGEEEEEEEKPGEPNLPASARALEDLFTPSELNVIAKYEPIAAEEAKGEQQDVSGSGEAYETETAKAWKGGLKEIEAALRRAD